MPRPSLRTALRVGLLAACLFLLQGCATVDDSVSTRVAGLLPADAILFGEQHDAPQHHVLERGLVRALAQQGRLAALVLEMSERGRSTAGLPVDAGAAAVREALRWDDDAWKWDDYGPVVMEAVRAGVPVLGANLSRSDMRTAMSDAALDTTLAPRALAQQQDNIRSGHCFLLPESQIGPMARVQLARDAAMARTIGAAARPGQTVLLIAGAGHVSRTLGVPQHLPATLRARVVLAVAGEESADLPAQADAVWTTPAMPPIDHCAALRRALQR